MPNDRTNNTANTEFSGNTPGNVDLPENNYPEKPVDPMENNYPEMPSDQMENNYPSKEEVMKELEEPGRVDLPENNYPSKEEVMKELEEPGREKKGSIMDEFEEINIEKPKAEKKGSIMNEFEEVQAEKKGSIMDQFEQVEAPKVNAPAKEAGVNPYPVSDLEAGANSLNEKINGLKSGNEIEGKGDILRQIAQMKRLTSQCLAVAEDNEMAGLIPGGKEAIAKGNIKVNDMDARLDILDASIRKGWPSGDLNALSDMAALAKGIEGLKDAKNILPSDKKKIANFIDFIEDIKKPGRRLKFDERYDKIEQAEKLLNELPDDAKEYEFKELFDAAKKSIENSQNLEPDEADIGNITNKWDDIKVQPFAKKDLAALKNKALGPDSTTLFAKCSSELGANEKGISKNDALKAYAVMFDKNSSRLHKDSAQFKQIKDGIKKTTGSNGTEADRRRLREDVKKWLTDPKYDRINKHGSSSFDNKRFNEMFALANELDPAWAKENFGRMKLTAHHGDKASAFNSINDFLNAEHRLMIDNNCIANSASQKNKAWYNAGKDGKVKNVKLSDLEKESGMVKNQGAKNRKAPQKNKVMQGPSHSM